MPVISRCQAIPLSATPIRPSPYITTKIVGLVKFDATNWLFRGLIGVIRGLNGQLSRRGIRRGGSCPYGVEPQLPGRTSTNPMRAERFPLHQTRLGLFGSISSLLGSDSESGSGNSTHSLVLGLKRAILSACCSLTQIRLFFRSTLTE